MNAANALRDKLMASGITQVCAFFDTHCDFFGHLQRGGGMQANYEIGIRLFRFLTMHVFDRQMDRQTLRVQIRM